MNGGSGDQCENVWEVSGRDTCSVRIVVSATRLAALQDTFYIRARALGLQHAPALSFTRGATESVTRDSPPAMQLQGRRHTQTNLGTWWATHPTQMQPQLQMQMQPQMAMQPQMPMQPQAVWTMQMQPGMPPGMQPGMQPGMPMVPMQVPGQPLPGLEEAAPKGGGGFAEDDEDAAPRKKHKSSKKKDKKKPKRRSGRMKRRNSSGSSVSTSTETTDEESCLLIIHFTY